MNHPHNQSLENSVASLGSSLSILRSSNENLENGVRDFSRLKTNLQTNKVFDIVTETDISNAKVEIAQETEPQIRVLLDRAEVELQRLERKKRSLTSKAQLQQVRLEQHTGRKSASTSSNAANSDEFTQQLAKLKELQQKKDRLQYSLSRLNLKGRKAKMSMAFAR